MKEYLASVRVIPTDLGVEANMGDARNVLLFFFQPKVAVDVGMYLCPNVLRIGGWRHMFRNSDLGAMARFWLMFAHWRVPGIQALVPVTIMTVVLQNHRMTVRSCGMSLQPDDEVPSRVPWRRCHEGRPCCF